MPSRPVGVEAHELVYGSAPRLLLPGATDLGVIASTRSFPADAARKLERHRDYTAYAPAATQSRYIVGMLCGRIEFSRIEMGTDHTGRRIPFARHLLLPLESSISCGDLVRRATVYATDPRQSVVGWIEPQPRLDPLPPPAPASPSLAKAVSAAAETVIRYQETKRPVVLVQSIPDSKEIAGEAVLELIAVIGDVLPRGMLSSWVAATHVIDIDDRLPEASILATYRGSPFYAAIVSRSGERKPLMIDAESLAIDGNTEPASAFGRATYADLISNSPGRFAGLCDRLQARPEHFGHVAEINTSLRRIETTPGLDNVEAFIEIVRKAGAVLDRNSLENLAVETISTALRSSSLDIVKDAASLQDGIGRLGNLLVIDESLQTCATKVGIENMGRNGGTTSQTLAAAIREAGEDAIAVASRTAAAGTGQQFLHLLIPPKNEPNTVESDPIGQGTEAVIKPKPQRRETTPSPAGSVRRLAFGIGYDGRDTPDDAPSSFGSVWTSRITVLSLLLAFVGLGLPVLSEYKPPPRRSLAAAETDANQPRNRVGGTITRTTKTSKGKPAVGNKDASEVFSISRLVTLAWDYAGALRSAIGRAWKRLLVPGVLGLITVIMCIFNGPATQMSVVALQRFVSPKYAWYLPTVAMLLASIASFFIGRSAQGPGAVASQIQQRIEIVKPAGN